MLGLYKGVHAVLTDVISRGITNGELRPCESRIVASVVLGIISWVPVSMRFLSGGVDSYSGFCQTVRDTLKFGIAKKRVVSNTFGKFDLSSFLLSQVTYLMPL